MSILDEYQFGQWRPLCGWRSDTEVIAALRTLIEDELGGVAGDLMPGDLVPREIGSRLPLGAMAGMATTGPGGAVRPRVFVRADLPPDLRVDLWGFGTSLAVCACEGTVVPDEDGMLFVGAKRRPVLRRGPALVGALILQRLGRRPGACDFPVYRQVEALAVR